ncbi:MAG: helix-turn-helix domain-containing protein [Bacteroidales bacterium]|nr:helix-turn-helix domain-containing protein [Bacteroidales bacterium]
MAAQIITTDDLHEFKLELIEDIKRLLKEANGQPSKKWLKSYELRKVLNLSPGTLQNLRVNGTLPYTKIGGVIYYDYSDIQEMLQSRKHKQPYLFSNQKI